MREMTQDELIFHLQNTMHSLIEIMALDGSSIKKDDIIKAGEERIERLVTRGIKRSKVEGYKEMIQNLQDHNQELIEENHKLRREMRLIKEVFRKENAS